MSISEQKRTLRETAQATRIAVAAAAGTDAAVRLSDHLVAWAAARPAAVVAGYLAIGSELDLLPTLEALAGQGRDVALPVVPGRDVPLVFRRWRAGMVLEDGPLGTRHPPADSTEVIPDVLLVPMLAFDDAGYRLGWGGGFYDRTLAGLRAKGAVRAVGVAYAGQRVDKVPRDDHDARLDWIATEAGIREVPAKA